MKITKKTLTIKKAAPVKMSPDQIAKRKKSMIANAAGKAMGGLYSK